MRWSLERTSPLVSCVAAVTIVAMIAPNAMAAQALATNCKGQFKVVFGVGSAICVTGDVDYKKPGTILPSADLYIVPTGTANPFVDASGAKNHVIGKGGGGAFFGELVWGKAKAGSYDFVIDHYPYGKWEPKIDWRGPGFNVIAGAPVNVVNLAAMKAAAKQGLGYADDLNTFVDILELMDALSTIVDYYVAFGTAGGIVGLVVFGLGQLGLSIPTSYNSAILAIGGRLIRNTSATLKLNYAGIVADPPDKKFFELPALDASAALVGGEPVASLSADPYAAGLVEVGKLIGVQAAAHGGLLHAMEKLQGAQNAKDALGRWVQARRLRACATLAKTAGQRMLIALDGVEADLKTKGLWNKELDGTVLQAALKTADTTGLTAPQKAALASLGIDEATALKGIKAAKKKKLPDAVGAKGMVDAARKSYQSVVGALDGLIAQADKITAETAAIAVITHPQLSFSPAASATVGVALKLSAAAAHLDKKAQLTFTWDTDGDGKYDDGTGKSIQWTPTVAGSQLVAVRVVDEAKRADVAEALITAKATNSPPVIESWLPANLAPFAKVGEAVPLSAKANDADGDPVALTWHVAGQQVAAGQAYTFTMPDEKQHAVRLTASDGNATTPDVSIQFVIRAMKYKQSGGCSGAGCGDAGGTADATSATDAGSSEDAAASDSAGSVDAGAPSVDVDVEGPPDAGAAADTGAEVEPADGGSTGPQDVSTGADAVAAVGGVSSDDGCSASRTAPVGHAALAAFVLLCVVIIRRRRTWAR